MLVLVHSLIKHKEFRFVFPVVPLLVIYAGKWTIIARYYRPAGHIVMNGLTNWVYKQSINWLTFDLIDKLVRQLTGQRHYQLVQIAMVTSILFLLGYGMFQLMQKRSTG